ncbi:MAG TPA: FAD-dependent oxidoreductase [Anaerolineae bacterium]
MIKPILLAVDDDRTVLGAVERDLRRRYGKDFRVVSADSGAAGLKALQQLKLKNEAVALLLVDQRMPQLTGVEFLVQAVQIYPDAKRVLLTAYADTDAAIRAINEVRLDHYLMKPWDPPEERLYPVLQDLLDDWLASFRPPFEGIRVIGQRWSRLAHEIKDFLARNQVPYQWVDVDDGQEAAAVMGSLGADAERLPVVLFPDGSRLMQPSPLQLAQKIGLKLRAEKPFYDLVIVGAGPAGLAAAVYGASEGLRTLLVEREAPGGQAGTSSRIENYLGFPVGLSGADLTRRAVAQAVRFGAEILTPQEAVGVTLNDPYRILTLADGSEVTCHALLVATGVSYRTLDAPGVEQLTGAGLYYGAAGTEGLVCHEQDVFVVGGGNSAGQAAAYLSQYARHVSILVRGPSLAATMSHYLIDQISRIDNISVVANSSVAAVTGNGRLETITIRNVDSDVCQTLPGCALFVFIGAAPRTDWVEGLLARDPQGFLLSGPDLKRAREEVPKWPLGREPYHLETNVPGIFVAGDVRHRSVKRVASAVGDGAMAVQFVHHYLSTV